MITMRAGPYASAVVGASCRTHSMLNRMCSRLPCSHDAESTVHQRPSSNTGIAPLAPSTNRLLVEGASIDMMPPPRTPLGSMRSDTTYSTAHPPITAGVKPKSCPSRRNATANPHIPGLRRPQERQRSSLTPTSLPHEGHTTDPVRCRFSIPSPFPPPASVRARPQVLVRPRALRAERMRRVQRPVRVAQQRAGQQHRVGLAGRDDLLGLVGLR